MLSACPPPPPSPLLPSFCLFLLVFADILAVLCARCRQMSRWPSRLQWTEPDLNRGGPSGLGNSGPHRGDFQRTGQRLTSPLDLPGWVGSAEPQLPEDMPEDVSEIFLNKMSEGMSEDISEHSVGRNVGRYVERNVRRYVKKSVGRNVKRYVKKQYVSKYAKRIARISIRRSVRQECQKIRQKDCQ